MQNRRQHLAPLDGLRSVAVILVVLSHSVPALDGGFYGVDLFFVLSGFLITGLLLEERTKRGEVDYRAFYIRRGLRLLPALVAMLVMVGCFVAVTGSNEHATRFPVAALSVLFYVGNWWQSLHNGLGYLAHCWSLAIEEQFYLVWPALLLAVVARRRRPVLIVAGGVMAVWLVRGAYFATEGLKHSPDGWTVFRFDGLLLGATLALLAHRLRLPAWLSSTAAGVAGAALVTVMIATFPGHPQGGLTLVVGYGVVSVGGTLILASCLASTWTARVLGWTPLVAVGRVSYGVYLYHFPIFQFVHNEVASTPARYAIEYPAAAVAVLLSWFLIERPALRLKDRVGRPREIPVPTGDPVPLVTHEPLPQA